MGKGGAKGCSGLGGLPKGLPQPGVPRLGAPRGSPGGSVGGFRVLRLGCVGNPQGDPAPGVWGGDSTKVHPEGCWGG